MGICTIDGDSALKATTPTQTSVQSEEEPLSYQLPDDPLVTIQPNKAWSSVELRDLWAFRELLYFLTWRDVKVRYKQTALGVAWAILQPLLTMLIFTLFFGRLAGAPSDNVPYPLFAYAWPRRWAFVSKAIRKRGNRL